MSADVGEYLVGAYLKVIQNCDVVDYNVRSPQTGIAGLAELDVMGLDFPNKRVYLCEVATHIGGLEYGKGYEDSADRIKRKFECQKAYAEMYLSDFKDRVYMFWAPRVPKGPLEQSLFAISGLTPVINKEYTEQVEKLRQRARATTKDIGNPVFRLLQILEHLR